MTAQTIHFQKVFWMRHPGARSFGFAVKDPHMCGFSHAIVIHPRREGGRMTVLCPSTLNSESMPSTAKEITGFDHEEVTGELRDRLVDVITRKWHELCQFGFLRSYDVAALALNILDAKVPTETPSESATEGREKRVHGRAACDELIRPVVKDSRRGEIASFFIDGGLSVREAMAVSGMSRSGVLTHLHGLSTQHGLGYALTGDSVTIELPEGCRDPFAGAKKKTKGKASEVNAFSPLPKRGKRLAIASAAVENQGSTLDQLAEAAGCSAASARSHLHDIRTKHGIGFIIEDGKVNMELPEGKIWKDYTG